MRPNRKLLRARQQELLEEMEQSIDIDEIKRLYIELLGIQCVMHPEDIVGRDEGVFDTIFGYEGGKADQAALHAFWK